MAVAVETAKMSQTVTQSLVTNTDTVINFDTLGFDSTGGRMPNLGSNRLVCSTPGEYLITSSLRYQAEAVAQYYQELNNFGYAIPNNTNSLLASITMPNAGSWEVSGSVHWNNSTIAGFFEEDLWLDNNGTVLAQATTTTQNSIWTAQSVSCTRGFSKGDICHLYCYQNSSSSGGINFAVTGVTPTMSAALTIPSEHYIAIWLNGNSATRLAEANSYSLAGSGALCCSTVAVLNQGDFVDLRGFQASGANLGTDVTYNDCHLSMTLLSPS